MGELFGKWYKWLYTRLGGRTWTSIIREDQENHPLLYMLIFLMVGILVVRFCKGYWWQLLIAFGFGILVGHLWF